jgi:multidrug efflux pump subunit AcrA (membrane-fusion protein)
MGKIEEQDGANVSFDVTGNVKRVYVEEGQFVKRGQVLAEVISCAPSTSTI